MKYKILEWTGIIPLCALGWLYDVVFHVPLTMTQAVVGISLFAVQVGAFIWCVSFGKQEALGEKEKG